MLKIDHLTSFFDTSYGKLQAIHQNTSSSFNLLLLRDQDLETGLVFVTVNQPSDRCQAHTYRHCDRGFCSYSLDKSYLQQKASLDR